MKVGILTFYNAVNVGAFLQLYALRSFLEGLGHETEVVRYPTPFLRNEFRSRLHKPVGLRRFTRLADVIAFQRFYRTHFDRHRIGKSDSLSGWNRYGAVIFGSDEIWNARNWFSGYIPLLFGRGINGPRKIAYAPSFGEITELGDLPAEIDSLLKDFSAISVRDHNSQSLVKRLIGRDVPLCLDPTLMYDFASELREDGAVGPGVVVYATHVPETDRQQIVHLARAAGLPIVGLGFHQGWTNLSHVGCHPLRALREFASARWIYTNTFHGVLFALKFNKPFILGDIAGKENKITSIFKLLGIQKNSGTTRSWDDALKTVPVSGYAIDALNTCRESSFSFLNAALG